MNVLFRCALLAVSSTSALPAQDLTGDWLGTLKAGGAELRIALHVKKGADSSLSAIFESIDQGASLPASSITLKDSTLNFTVDAIHGSYSGKINPDANSIAGIWSQGQSLPLEFRRGAIKAPKPAKPSEIDGAWQGTLEAGSVKLRLVFHILNTEDGLTATFDSPDEGAKGIPALATRNGASLKLEVKAAGIVFNGKIASDLKSISGTYVQGPNSIPFVLSPLKESAQSRPQDPVKPYPYREEQVSYENKIQPVHLAATLTTPPGEGPFPGVVLITGSGPQDRDETLAGHRPFLVLSDFLTRHGIAVLRADDRGVGQSTGDFAASTTADFATDAEASLAYLKTRPEVNPRKLGLVGHSEGGTIAPMVAARNSDVAFIVMLAGTGVPGDQIATAQVEALAKLSGKSHAEAETQASLNREVLLLAEQGKDDSVIENKIRQVAGGEISDSQVAAQIQPLHSPWVRFYLQYDPATALRKVTCPVLALNGSKDTQVVASQNLPAIRKALEAAGNTHFEILELPGLNHLFQTAKTGSLTEYAEIDETISPTVLTKVSSWILQQ